MQHDNVDLFIPGAQVTRKLAVAVVDAARVFEMLVPVILVGEHFATTLTLKPFADCMRRANTTITVYV